MVNKPKTYDDKSRQGYLLTLDRLGKHWLDVFDTQPEDKTFWDAAYWDLFTRLWRAGKKVNKTTAISYINGKTAPTATKYLKTAIDKKLIIEYEPDKDNKDERSKKLYQLSDEMRQRIDLYLDAGITETGTFVDNIKEES